MKNTLIYLCLCFVGFALNTCRKKTNIEILVYNYALAEPIANADVVLVERHQNGWGKTSCEEVAKGTTDINGECSLSKEKLRKNKNYVYYLAITSAYGISQNYPGEGKTSGFIDKGGARSVTLEASHFDAFFKVQLNNLLSPSQAGDSLIAGITNPRYQVPGESVFFLEGGVLGNFSVLWRKWIPIPKHFNFEFGKN